MSREHRPIEREQVEGTGVLGINFMMMLYNKSLRRITKIWGSQEIGKLGKNPERTKKLLIGKKGDKEVQTERY